MNSKDVSELKHNIDGSYEFRLLSKSLNKIKIENITIKVSEPDYVFTRNDENIMSETPQVPVEFQVHNACIKKILGPQESLSNGQWNLQLKYAFSGEENRIVQSAIYFKLSLKKE
jgi:hypothetical protein